MTRMPFVAIALLSAGLALGQADERTPSGPEAFAQRTVEEIEASALPENAAQTGEAAEVVEDAPRGEMLDTPPQPGEDTMDAQTQPNIRVESGMDEDLFVDINAIELDEFYDALGVPESGERLPLSLGQCIALALAANDDIEIAELDPLSNDGNLMAARGEFDPVIQGDYTHTQSVVQASSQTVAFGGVTSIETFLTQATLSISGRLHWGTSYTLRAFVDEEQSTFNRFDAEFSGDFSFTLTQPLLRGRGKAANLARVRQAKNSRLISEENLRLTVMQSLNEVISAYWDLVGAIETVRVRYKSMENAARLLDITERRLDIGTASPLDVVQAKAGIATRQSDLISARAAVQDAADRLKRLVDLEDGGLLSPRPIMPVDRPDPRVGELDVEESIQIALEVRPDLRAAELNTENADIERKRARNDMLPQLDVSGTVATGARGPQLSNVFEGAADRSDHRWSMSINGSLPLRNRAARGSFHQAEISVRQNELQYERTKQDLVLGVRNAYRDVEESRALVESNRQSRIVQETNLAAEERRLRLGMTTNFQVLEIEEDLTTAEVQEVQSLVRLEQSIAALRFAEGALLRALGIEFVAPEPERTSNFFTSVTPFVKP